MVLASTRVVKQVVVTSIHAPRGSPTCVILSQRYSKISKCFDPGFFQITVSVLLLRVCEILPTPFKSSVSLLQPSSSPITSLAGFQSQTF